MAIKLIILCGLFAIALGFTLPEDYIDDPSNTYELAFGDDILFNDDSAILVRNARSPQRRIDAGMEHSSRFGTSANVNYNHPLSRNMEAYAGASRNFKYNDNSGHVGLRYKF